MKLLLRSLFLLLFLAGTIHHTSAQIFIKNDHAEEYYDQAYEQFKEKNYKKAIELSKTAYERRPEFPDNTALLAQLYMTTKQYALARPVVARMIKDDPKNKDGYYYAMSIELYTNNRPAAINMVNKALQKFPNDKAFWAKKIGLLSEARSFVSASNTAQRALNLFPYDKDVRKAALNHYQQAGSFYLKSGNLPLSGEYYNKAYYLDQRNTEINDALLSIYGKENNYESALTQINSLLAANERSSTLLYKKLGILQAMRRYPEALEVLQLIQKYFPGDAKAKTMEPDLRLEAGRYYSSSDPYLVYESVLDKNPGNTEALNKVINISMTRGSYNEALNWINVGLKSNPKDVKLLVKKMDIQEIQRNYAQAAQVAGKLLAIRPTADFKSKYSELHTILGREYMGDQLYDMARTEFALALKVSPAYKLAHDAGISSYIFQRDNSGALQAIDKALRYFPQDQTLLMKKIDVLAALGRNGESARIAGMLMNRDPLNKKLSSGFAEQRLLTGRDFLAAEEYDRAEEQFKQVLKQDNRNREALSYLINLYSAVNKFEQGLIYANQALIYYPDDRDFLLKKSSLLTELKRYPEANFISKKLMDKYPYTKKYRTAYLDGTLTSARNYQKKGLTDSALFEYGNLLAAKPNDSTALSASSGLLIERKKYNSAMKLINNALIVYPASADFIRKKVVVYEQENQFEAAALAADSLYKLQPTATNREHADFLKSKTFKNQFGMYFLNSTFDNAGVENKQSFNIGTLEYRRFFGKGSSFAGRINYAGRSQGTGLQGEGEVYLKHSKKFYSFATAGFSNGLVFPSLRLHYSLFAQLGGDFEGEIGGRYLKTSASPSLSGVLSLAKTFDDFWMNFRVYGISDRPANETHKFYQTYTLTARYHLNPQMDFVSFYAGLGTSPDDRSRIIQFPQLVGLLSRNIGAGYQKNIRYRNTLAFNGTWYNQKISRDTFQNQYDLYFTFLRKF